MNQASDEVDRDALRRELERHLSLIGLNGEGDSGELSKDAIRGIHRVHRRAAQARVRRALGKNLNQFVQHIANGNEVDPTKIRPKLIEARSGTEAGNLFRFATLSWSIPVSQGFGRRLRYLVVDEHNERLIGVFALGDPVFNLRVRDDWIGWTQSDRRERLVNVMDAYVVGAMPPYADLLGGKLVTTLIASEEIGLEFQQRYANKVGVISKKAKQPRLTLVTVTSALGRSSIYNRLKLMSDRKSRESRPVVELSRLGSTVGYGHFQIPDELFRQIRRVLQEDGHRYADGHQFGDGPNWRIRVIRTGLEALGLNPDKVLRHGIKREVFAMPIARNAREYLDGSDTVPDIEQRPAAELAKLARERWVVPRADRRPSYRDFRRDSLCP